MEKYKFTIVKKVLLLMVICLSVSFFSFLGAAPIPPFVLLNDDGEHYDLSEVGEVRPYRQWLVYIPDDNLSLPVIDRPNPIELSLRNLIRMAFSQWSDALQRERYPGIGVLFTNSRLGAIFSVNIDQSISIDGDLSSVAVATYPEPRRSDNITFYEIELASDLGIIYDNLITRGIISQDITIEDFTRECMYLLTESLVANMFSITSSSGNLLIDDTHSTIASSPIVDTSDLSEPESTRPSIVFTNIRRGQNLEPLSLFIQNYNDWLHSGGTITFTEWNNIHEISRIDGRTLAHLRQAHVVPGNVDPRRFLYASQRRCYGRYNLSCEQIERRHH